MAYSESLANRTREIISRTHDNVEEKKMFGGLCFMVDDKMCVGVGPNRLLVRLDPDKYEEVLEKPGCTPMNFGGRTMRGYVHVSDEVLATKKQLEYWVNLALEHNPFAESSKKKKRKP